jgi:hypothetical protein
MSQGGGSVINFVTLCKVAYDYYKIFAHEALKADVSVTCLRMNDDNLTVTLPNRNSYGPLQERRRS